MLHAVGISTLVGIAHATSNRHSRVAVGIVRRRREARLVQRRGEPGTVAAALHNIAFDRIVLDVVHGSVQVLTEHALALERVWVTVSAERFAEVSAVDRCVVSTAAHAQFRVAKSQVRDRRLAVECGVRAVELLALQLVLDALAVGCVANQRKNRTNALHKERTLCGLRIVQSGLRITLQINGDRKT